VKKHDKARVKKGLCLHCGRRGVTQIHHIYYGSYRNRAEKADFVIELCPECHALMHNTPLGDKLKRSFQQKYEETHSREEFLKKMGRSWL
jgi:hypothetical protein